MLPIELMRRASQIQLLALDVDGVLTDGRLYFGPQGEMMKAFHVRDGAGIVQLQPRVQIAIISGRESTAVTHRAAELRIAHVYQGIKDKHAVLLSLKQKLGISEEGIACVGDDTPDLAMFPLAHLAIAVADAHPKVRDQAHWVTPLPGGQGAVRSVCDLLLGAQESANGASL